MSGDIQTAKPIEPKMEAAADALAAWVRKRSKEDLRVFYAEGGEWVIATDPADAAKVYEEHVGEKYAPHGPPEEWVAEPMDKAIEIRLDDGTGTQTKTCAEWAAQGRGYLCSENF